MKTKEELYTLKEEVKALNRKLAELSEDELEQVSGGTDWHEMICVFDPSECGLRYTWPDRPCPYSPDVRAQHNCDGCPRLNSKVSD